MRSKKSDDVNICPMCLHDYLSEENTSFVWSNIFEKKICEYCDLEFGLEFQEGFSEIFTQKAVNQSGYNVWECKRRYLNQIIDRIKSMLAENLDSEERAHREWNLSECLKQLGAIEAYQYSLINADEDSSNVAKLNMENALKTSAFGLDLLRPYMNYLSD